MWQDMVQIVVNVIDVNIYCFVFQSFYYIVNVNEDWLVGIIVVLISVMDEDIGENVFIIYFMEDSIFQFCIDVDMGCYYLG